MVYLWRWLPYPLCTHRHTHTQLCELSLSAGYLHQFQVPALLFPGSQWEEISLTEDASRQCLSLPWVVPNLVYQWSLRDNLWWDKSPQPVHTERLLPPVNAVQPHPSHWNKTNPVCPQISSHQGMGWAVAQEFKRRLDKWTPWWSDSCWPGSGQITREHHWNNSVFVMGNAIASGSFKLGKNLLFCGFFFYTNSYPE